MELGAGYDFCAVEDDGYRAVVYEGDLHHSLEAAGFDLGDVVAEDFYEVFEGVASLIGRCCADVAGATPFAAVGEEGELADGEEGSAGVEEGAIHFAICIGEDAEVDELAGHGFHDFRVVVCGDAYEEKQAGSDGTDCFVVDRYAGGGYSLENNSHGVMPLRLFGNCGCRAALRRLALL